MTADAEDRAAVETVANVLREWWLNGASPSFAEGAKQIVAALRSRHPEVLAGPSEWANARRVVDCWDIGPSTDDDEWHSGMAVLAVGALRAMIATAPEPTAPHPAALIADAARTAQAWDRRPTTEAGGGAEFWAPMHGHLADEMARVLRAIVSAAPAPTEPDRIAHSTDCPDAMPVPTVMDRRHPDGVVAGDPVPEGIDPDIGWDNQCPRRLPIDAFTAYRCSRLPHDTGQHVVIGAKSADCTGTLAVLVVWPAGEGFVSA